jgi:cell division protein FtsN
MANQSSGFLTKSVIVLSLFLISMGVSLLLGKMMGRNIMAMAKSNIEQHFPDKDGKGGQDGNLSNAFGGQRSDFGFNPGEFAPMEAPRSSSEGEKMSFSTVQPEPDVDITLLPDKPEDSGAPSEDPTATGEDTASNPEDASKPKPSDGGKDIFKLSDSTLFRIQVGTFSSTENAESVWRRLTQAGYDAHMSSFKDANGEHFKVYVGAYHKREDADKVAEKLRAMNFDAWVYQEK